MKMQNQKILRIKKKILKMNPIAINLFFKNIIMRVLKVITIPNKLIMRLILHKNK